MLKIAKHCYIKYIKETSYILVYTRKYAPTEGLQKVIAFVNWLMLVICLGLYRELYPVVNSTATSI